MDGLTLPSPWITLGPPVLGGLIYVLMKLWLRHS
jgi:hypothetical protein